MRLSFLGLVSWLLMAGCAASNEAASADLATSAGAGGSKDSRAVSAECAACLRSLCQVDCPGTETCEPCTVNPSLCSVDAPSQARSCACSSCAAACGSTLDCEEGTENPPVGAGGAAGGGGGPLGAAGSPAPGQGGKGQNDAGSDGGGAGGVGSGALDCQMGPNSDGLTGLDCSKPMCGDVCSDPCKLPTVLNLESDTKIDQTSSWQGRSDVFTPDCASSAKTGPDVVYRVTNKAGKPGFLRFSAQATEGNVVLSLRTECSASSSDVVCRDVVAQGGAESIEVKMEAGSSVFVVVGSAQAASAGLFSIHAELVTPYCGNGVVEPGEECDEGEGGNSEDGQCTLKCLVATCANSLPIDDGSTSAVTEAQAKTSSLLTPSCASAGTPLTEYVHSFRAKNSGLVQLVAQTDAATQGQDLVLSLLESCKLGSGELSCVDRSSGGTAEVERIVAPVEAGKSLFAMATYAQSDASVPYRLFLRSYPLGCGDGVVSPLEQCDGSVGCDQECLTVLPELPQLEAEPNDSAGLASDLLSGAFNGKLAVVGGRLDKAGDLDHFRVTVTKPGKLSLRIDDPGDGSCRRGTITAVPEGILDSEVQLLSPAGELIASNDNAAGEGFCSRLSVGVQPGAYVIRVKASPTAPAQRFAYRLEVTVP